MERGDLATRFRSPDLPRIITGRIPFTGCLLRAGCTMQRFAAQASGRSLRHSLTGTLTHSRLAFHENSSLRRFLQNRFESNLQFPLAPVVIWHSDGHSFSIQTVTHAYVTKGQMSIAMFIIRWKLIVDR